MNKYPHGAAFAIKFTTKNASGVLTDVPDPKVKLKQDVGSVTTLTSISSPAVTKLSTGTYEVLLRVGYTPILAPGGWHWEAISDGGSVIDAAEGYFVAMDSVFW